MFIVVIGLFDVSTFAVWLWWKEKTEVNQIDKQAFTVIETYMYV